jgi:hypothetical protein
MKAFETTSIRIGATAGDTRIFGIVRRTSLGMALFRARGRDEFPRARN